MEKCKEGGFDFQKTLAADGHTVEADLGKREADILTKSSEIASHLDLEDSFFEHPSDVIMLTGIADSLVMLDEKMVTASEEEGEKITAEKAAWEDMTFMLAGNRSKKSVRMAESDPTHKDRYIKAEDTSDSKEVDEFLNRIVDEQLSSQMADLFSQHGGGSFLSHQRKIMGITLENELPFTIRVLNAGGEGEMYTAHVQEKPNYPDWHEGMTDEETKEMNRLGSIALAVAESNKMQRESLVANETAFNEKFADKCGELLPAFVSEDSDGKKSLTLRAPQAMAVMKYYKEGALPEDPIERADIERIASVVRHEYGHTQKQLTRGPHIQLGLLIEERKAELISGDKNGYMDVKFFMKDIGMVAGIRPVDLLEKSLSHDDPLSAFTSDFANAMGLRNTLFMMALKPLPYENNPTHAKQFVDFSPLLQEGDASTLDIAVRESLQSRGDVNIKKIAGEWAGGLNDGQLDFVLEFNMDYRESHGLRQATPNLVNAILAEKKRRGLSTE